MLQQRVANLIGFFCLVASLASATTIRPVSVEHLTAESTHVVEGQAVSSYAAWDAEHKGIYTYTTFQVTKVLKGQLAQSTVIVKQYGGRVGDMVAYRPGVRSLPSGQETVLFLFPSPNGDGTMAVTGLMQGNFTVTHSAAGSKMVSNGVPAPSPDVPTYEAGTPVAHENRMPLTTLEERVKSALTSKEVR